MLNIFKNNNKKVENLESIKIDEEKQSIKSFEEYAKEHQFKDDESMKDCLTSLSNFKTLDKSDKLIFITDSNYNYNVVGKTNLNSTKTLFECNFITKKSYDETYLNRTYTGFTYESRRMRIYMSDKGTPFFSNFYGTDFWIIDSISEIQKVIRKITDYRNFNKSGECEDKTIMKVNLLTDNMSPDCRELYYFIKDI